MLRNIKTHFNEITFFDDVIFIFGENASFCFSEKEYNRNNGI